MTYLDYLEKKVLLERLVIGLEEPVLVKGLGELQAKIDSGNGGYNVIHGTDFHQQGDVLMFTTHDNFGHEKKISAKIITDRLIADKENSSIFKTYSEKEFNEAW